MEQKDIIKKLREREGLSQQELADKLHISRSALSNYEQGSRIPRPETEDAMADFFNVSVDYLRGKESGNINQIIFPESTSQIDIEHFYKLLRMSKETKLAFYKLIDEAIK